MRCINGNTTLTFLWGIIDLLKFNGSSSTSLGQDCCDGSRQCCLAVIDVTDCTDVQMRFVSDKGLLLRVESAEDSSTVGQKQVVLSEARLESCSCKLCY